MSVSNIISHAERTGSLGDDESLREVLDFLVTEEQLGRQETGPMPARFEGRT